MKPIPSLAIAAVAALTLLSPRSRADEGMWLFNKPPTKQIQAKYGFELTPQWLEHVQKSCVRISTGGSGSIVSPNGLVMTNHHVGSDMLEKLSTGDKDYIKDGFYARSYAEEVPCPDLEINVLWTIEDVTERVNKAVPATASLAEQNSARRKELSAIEAQSLKETGLKSEVVTLYQGGRYHLYRYKRYEDVRLVMAPEKDIAFFGGDPDNFEFPRFDLDMCFFRIYEGGKPLAAEHYLKWSRNGATDNELVFVTGHPGRTERLNTHAHLEFMRDTQYPLQMRNMWRREVQLATFMGRSEEFRRIAEGDFFGIQNTRKARTGILAGLQDPALMAQKLAAETELRKAVAANPQWEKDWGDAWSQVEAAKRVHSELLVRLSAFGGPGMALGGTMFGAAKDLVRLADESAKSDGERLREYRESNKASFEFGLYSPAPVYPDLEVEKLAASLQLMVELLGGKDPAVVQALAGKAPRERAEELIRGSGLADVAVRKRVAAGGKDAITSSSDPLIQMVRSLDGENRALRKRYEEEVDAREKAAYAKIAAAKFAKYGEDQYPDATFTLRLSYGAVKGYPQGGKQIVPFTNFAGLYARAEERGNVYPFEVPKRWLAAKSKLNLNTPFNFVSSCDIIGGNSGSPTINRAGEVVGLIFDGNIQSLVGNLMFDETYNRAVSVDSRAMIEALRTVYGMERLADEIVGAGT
ncbi:MAG: S46 family peptidase [Planctomycetota bacterium]|nr:S46 family peptidase [Planctomycetota bacterium]